MFETQRAAAKSGKVTSAMEQAARHKGVSVEMIRAGLADGSIAVPINRNHTCAEGRAVGCLVKGDDPLVVEPPSWRPDLTMPADLVEEVVRLEGYEKVPAVLPTPPPGSGLTEAQRLRRTISRALAASGCTEVITSPFVTSRKTTRSIASTVGSMPWSR